MKQALLDPGEPVFNEDRIMLQAQQKIMDADPSQRVVLFDVDRAPTPYCRLVGKLVKEETAGASAAA